MQNLHIVCTYYVKTRSFTSDLVQKLQGRGSLFHKNLWIRGAVVGHSAHDLRVVSSIPPLLFAHCEAAIICWA